MLNSFPEISVNSLLEAIQWLLPSDNSLKKTHFQFESTENWSLDK